MGLSLVEVPAGAIAMAPAQKNDPPRQVTLPQPLFMADRHVSADLFIKFLRDLEYPSAEKPVENEFWKRQSGEMPFCDVSWYDAVLFCNWLSWREGRSLCYARTGAKDEVPRGDKLELIDAWSCDFAADGYRLPTEAEWEYACRAGATTTWAFGDDEELLPHYAVFLLSSKGKLHPGGTKLPNAWGLFDMHGNARGWCWERTGSPVHGAGRAIRGASWQSFTPGTVSAFRYTAANAHDRDSMTGFRVVCRPPPTGERKKR